MKPFATDPGSTRRRTMIIGGLIWGAAIVMLLVTVPSLGRVNDYQTDFYVAGQAVLSGTSPYAVALNELPAGISPYIIASGSAPPSVAPYVYPPPFALILAPLSALPYAVAGRLWYWVNVAALIFAAMLLGRYLSRDQPLIVSGLVFAAFVGFAPIRFALGMGQTDVLVLLCVIAALPALRAPNRHRSRWQPILGGALLGAGCVIKIYPIGLVALALLRRQFRLALAAAGSAVALLLTAVLVMGSGVLGDYLRTSQMGSGPGLVAFPFSFGVLAFAYRALTANPYAIPLLHLAPTLIKAFYVAGLAVVAISVAAILGVGRDRTGWSDLSIAAVAALVVFPYLEIQHLTLLLAVLPGLAWAATSGLGMRDWSPVRRSVLGLTILTPPLLLAALGSLQTGRVIAVSTLLLMAVTSMALWHVMRPSQLPAAGRVAVLAAGCTYLALASPAFLNMAAWWPVPISSLHVVLGEGELYLLIALAIALVAIRTAFRQPLAVAPGQSVPETIKPLPVGAGA